MKKLLAVIVFILTFSIARGQDGRDIFSITWPARYQLKIYNKKTGVELPKMNPGGYWVDIDLLPQGETNNNWTIFCSVICHQGSTGLKRSVPQAIAEIKQAFPGAELTQIEQDSRWQLLKLDNTRSGQSGLFYIFSGAWGNLYVADVLVKKQHPSAEFIAEWSTVFKNNNYIYW